MIVEQTTPVFHDNNTHNLKFIATTSNLRMQWNIFNTQNYNENQKSSRCGAVFVPAK